MPAQTAPLVDRVDLSVVIPLYRDAGFVENLFERVGAALDQYEGSVELVLVDDGSMDTTAAEAEEQARGFRHTTTLVRLARNFGQHPAVFAGLAHSRGDVVVTMDSDLQYPPEDMHQLIEALSDEFPVVSGYRKERRDPPIRRFITRQLTRWLNRRTGVELQDFGSMFRAYDRTVVDQMLTVTERHRYLPAVVAWLGVRVKEVPVSHVARGEQGSRYRIGGLIEMVLDLVTGYAVFPLRLVTFFALIASLLGFAAALVFLIYRIVVGDGVSGSVSALALIFFLIAGQLLAVAMIGEYVGRIYTEAKARPYYLVGHVFTTSGKTSAREL